MTEVVVECTSKIVKVIYPANSKKLQKAAATKSLSGVEKPEKKKATRKRLFDETRTSISDFISNLTNGSIAKRVANALIQACLPDEGIITQN